MSDWQPIETAPKDGTRILARNDRLGADFWRWHEEIRIDAAEGEAYISLAHWERETTVQPDYDIQYPPTHWMLLPEPPK